MNRLAGHVFVGRGRELAELHTALEDVLSGHGRVVLLVGEPGIGKTRLAEEFAFLAQQRGLFPLWGRCWEGEGQPAFWPWVQIVRTYAQQCSPAVLAKAMATGAIDIAQMVPELRSHLPDLPRSVEIESAQARFRLFDHFTSFLKNVSQSQPLVLLLDDLQWADTPSLLLLQFVAREIRQTPLFVLGTYRNGEVEAGLPLAEALGTLARESHRIVLQGLTVDEVARFIENTIGTKPAASLVTSVYEQTEGNPFFVSETVRLLDAEGQLYEQEGTVVQHLGIPPGIRATIQRRLRRLSAACTRLLGVASVIGRDFTLDMLERVSEQKIDRNRLLELVDEALEAHIISELPNTVDHYRFTHGLVRETLYADLSTPERTRLHRRVGETLETLHPNNLESRLAELAHHFFEATRDGGETKQALEYAQWAGNQAREQFAYEEAVGHYTRALRVLELQQVDQVRYCELLLALGDAQMRAGDVRQARETLRQAGEMARQQRLPEHLARTALSFAGGGDVATRFDEPMVSLLEEALAALPTTDSVLRTRVMSRLAMALYFSPFEERRHTLSRQAVEMARRIGDLTTLASALSARHMALLGPDTLDERLALATETIQLATQVDRKENVLAGHLWRLMDLLELGDRITVHQEIQTYTQLAKELRQPFYLWHATVLRALWAILTGQFEEGEQCIQEGLILGQRAQTPNAPLLFAVQLFALRREQGRLQELVEPVKALVQRHPAIPSLRAGLAFLYSELGRTVDAQGEFEQLATNQFADFPRDQQWFTGMALLAQVAAFLGDTHHAAMLYELLRPYAERNVVVGSATDYYGSVSRYLGLLATTLSRWEAAVNHFENALAMNTRMDARPLVACTQYDYACLLLSRHQSRSASSLSGQALQKARTLLDQAFHTAHEIGMKRLEEKIETVWKQIAGNEQQGREKGQQTALTPQVTEHQERQQSSGENIFRQEGSYWTLQYGGTAIRLKATKGIHYIAHLLRQPGRDIHVFDLLALTDQLTPSPATTSRRKAPKRLVSHSPAAPFQPVAVTYPDTHARTAYRQRLADLTDELDEAERFSDPLRVTKLKEAIDFLTEQLAADYGIGMHARARKDEVEKTRKAVTNRIRATLTQLQKAHPTLWRHLFTSIRTGTFCAYRPDHAVTWQL